MDCKKSDSQWNWPLYLPECNIRVLPPQNLGLEVGGSKVYGGTHYLRKHGISFFTVSSVVFFGMVL